MKIGLAVMNRNTSVSLLLDVVVKMRLICCTYPNLGSSSLNSRVIFVVVNIKHFLNETINLQVN